MQNTVVPLSHRFDCDLAGQSQADLLQKYISSHIPMIAAMQVCVLGMDEQGGLRLQAPLSVNVNDKGTAFGGSISALLTIAGWGWLWLANQQANITQNILIHRSTIAYERPLDGDLLVVCPAPDEAAWVAYQRALQSRGRARLLLQPVLLQTQTTVAASMQAEYVAIST